jgi:hypothetical protein
MIPKLLEELMTYVLAGAVVALFAGVALVADHSRSVPSSVIQGSTKSEVCEFNSRSWSVMRQTLVDISRFRGKNDANVQHRPLRGRGPRLRSEPRRWTEKTSVAYSADRRTKEGSVFAAKAHDLAAKTQSFLL